MAFLISLVALLILLAGPARGVAPARIVAIGDIHGAYDTLLGMLRATGLVDEQARWIGGKAVLVQTGDMMDRGAGVKQVMDLLMTLESQASKAGGRVQVLLGNHELMNLAGNTRDATDEIFKSFGGYAEYRNLLAPKGRYGRWLRSKSIATVVERTLFMHAGVSPEQAPASVKEINERVRNDLKAWDDGMRWMEEKKLVPAAATMQDAVTAAQAQLAEIEKKRDAKTLTPEDVHAARVLIPVAQILQSSLFAAEGPMWFRGYATWTDAEGPAKTAALLEKYSVKRIVSGHSPLASGRITARFGGAIFLIDTGMLGPPHYKTGRASALELTGDTATAIYADERVPLRAPGAQ